MADKGQIFSQPIQSEIAFQVVAGSPRRQSISPLQSYRTIVEIYIHELNNPTWYFLHT